MPRVSREATDILLSKKKKQKTKKKKPPKPEKLRKRNRQFIERILEHLKRCLIMDMAILITRSHFRCAKLAKIKASNNTNNGKAK